MQYCVIIPAAGSAKRFKKDKLTLKINGDYLINHTLSNFSDDNDCTKIVLVVNENRYAFYKNLYCLNNKILVVKVNTLTRSESVQQGLEYCKKSDYILVHDGCRPYLTDELITKVKQGLQDGYDAVCPVIDITDSVISIEHKEPQYLCRENLKRIQTPQGFKTKVLLEAFNIKSNSVFNDELSLVLSSNKKIKHLLVNGEVNNIKITTPEDVSVIDYDYCE